MSDDDEKEERSRLLKSAYDVQRMKLEKLMKNPEKPVVIPDRPKDKKNIYVPEFVRNVMGSSAGAGSGEFHVYRHLRRKEYARQKAIAEMSEKERLDFEFQERLLQNQKEAEERTAKKRAKRLKKNAKRKEKMKQKRMKCEKTQMNTDSCGSTGNDSDLSENDEKNENVEEETKNESATQEKDTDV